MGTIRKATKVKHHKKASNKIVIVKKTKHGHTAKRTVLKGRAVKGHAHWNKKNMRKRLRHALKKKIAKVVAAHPKYKAAKIKTLLKWELRQVVKQRLHALKVKAKKHHKKHHKKKHHGKKKGKKKH